MATLLHLSDLHLGAGGDEHFGDHKIQVIPADKRESRMKLLRSSFQNLGESLRRKGEVIDSIVISGDVTFQADAGGMSDLVSILDNLGDSRPDNERVVVVPGNHDVVWNTAPGSVERYKRFRDSVCDAGFVTPPLEATDPDVGTERGILRAIDGSFVVLALNSSDNCGVTKQVSRLEQAVLDAVDRDGNTEAKQLLEMWRGASLFDVARIDPGQLEHAHRALEAAMADLPADRITTPLRIATFHHQLLPQ